MSPHGLQHAYKTMVIELGTQVALMDVQMGHEDGSVQAIYSHVAAEMTQRLLDGLTTRWVQALVTRRALHARSPVPVLDRLLAEVPQ